MIGLIGAGNIGVAVARLLAAAGLAPMLQGRNSEAVATLAAELGAVAAGDAHELVDACDIVVGCLRDAAAIEAVYFGPHGAASGSPAIFVELATLGPDDVIGLAGRLAAAGHRLVYAAISGLPLDIAAGRALLLTAGSDDAIAAVRPMLDTLGNVQLVGEDVAAASVMKLAVNMMVFASICATSEALLFADGRGIDPAVAFDLLAMSPGAPATLASRRAQYLTPDDVPVQAPIALALKVITTIEAAAAASDAQFAQLSANRAMLAAAAAAGHGARDIAALWRCPDMAVSLNSQRS